MRTTCALLALAAASLVPARHLLALPEDQATSDGPAVGRSAQPAQEAARPNVVLIYVDDLGAGYSSLSVLAELQPAYVKVDMSIVRNIDTDSRKQRLVDLLVRFADATDATLVAEGVETEAEAAALRDCGAHLLQGTAYAVARGRSTDLAYKAVQGQIPLLFWRLPAELKVYDEATSRAPQHARVLLVQRLKFLGHWLETAHKLAILGFYAPTAEQKKQMAGAAQQLALTVEALEQQGMYAAMDRLRTEDEQLYLDLIGDSAHALHALRIARGEHTIAW